MKKYTFFFIVILFIGCSTKTDYNKLSEQQRWQKRAENVEIIRDDFGIPHIYGKTDADAVFGLLYAQCEDDFNRVERNYIWAIGRLAEVEGEKALYSDLRARLYMTREEAIKNYEDSPKWLRELCVAFADGINYYLHNHPAVQPKLLTRFEPWMPMYFSEGSIGGDIERVSTNKIKAFYGQQIAKKTTASLYKYFDLKDDEPRGSNGFAISGKLTQSGNAMLLINPHTSFFFRGEVHMVSEEGLNAYGAVTWGQFFVYQGFNSKTGWMHTSTGTDIIDEFAETIEQTQSNLVYKYGNKQRNVKSYKTTLRFKTDSGSEEKTFNCYRTHHGPVTHAEGDKWIATALMWEPVKALRQSYLRMKNSNHREFKAMMNQRTNSSNNTVYADADGTIAYYHGNFIPIRDVQFDYTKPVDGSNPQTDWQGLHTVEENIFVVNPPNGWIQNCNSTPYTCAAEYSPKKEDYPAYMTSFPENYRGIHAVDLLSKAKNLDLEKLIELAYDPFLPAAKVLTNGLLEAWEEYPHKSGEVKKAMELMKNWDYTVSRESIPMTLCFYYHQQYIKEGILPRMHYMDRFKYIGSESPKNERIKIFKKAMKSLAEDFGSWQTPWGEFNRYQRNNGDIYQFFDDAKPSIPVGMASGRWGALASFGARKGENTKRQYGVSGNSFVAVVEFGKKVKAKSMLAGGQSGNPNSPHFSDQAQRYADCKFKDVAYYKEDVLKRAQKRYHPGKE